MDNSNVSCNFYFEDTATNRKNLFHKALLSAKDGKVLYILCDELEELPELSQDLSSVNRHYMKMISFLYVKTLASLLESLSTLSDWQSVPTAIILDDLSRFCGKDCIQNACGVVALLIDAAHSCSVGHDIKCNLSISVNRDAVGEEYCNILKELYCMT